MATLKLNRPMAMWRRHRRDVEGIGYDHWYARWSRTLTLKTRPRVSYRRRRNGRTLSGLDTRPR